MRGDEPSSCTSPKRFKLFTDLSWFFVLHGMGLKPRDYDPLVDAIDFEQVKSIMQQVRTKIAADVAAAPSHDSFFPQKPINLKTEHAVIA